MRKKELPRAIGFKIPYSDGFWTQGKALRQYIIENKIRVVHLVRNNVVRRLISQISNRLDETYVKAKKRALEARKRIYSQLEEHEQRVEQTEEEKEMKKNQRKGTLNRLRANIGAGHQPHPKTEEENKKLQDMKPRISKENFLARLDIISDQLGTAKEIMERWETGIDEFGTQFEPIKLIEVTYEDLVNYQKSSLYALEDFLSVPRYVNTTSSFYQIHSGSVKDLVREPNVLEDALIGTQYEKFLYE